MTPNDPTPESGADEPATDADESIEEWASAPAAWIRPGQRLPPGPGDVPIANLPPPAPGAEEGADDDADAAPDTGETSAASDDAALAEAEAEVEDGAPDDLAEVALSDEAEDGESGEDGEDEGAPHGAQAEPEVDAVDETVPGAGAEDGEEAVAPAAEEPGDGPGARRLRWTRTRVLVVAVLVAMTASALALTKAQQVDDLTAQRDDRRAIERVAERFGSAYLSFDFEHVEASAGAVRALATPSFAASYADQSAPGIQELFSSRQTTTKATTTAVYLGGVTSRAARVLVVVDVTATSPTDGEQRLDDVSFVLDLARTDDGWRVAKVARAPQPTLDDGPTTTTTASPAG